MSENRLEILTDYKYRGQVDLMVTDPPYNTGQYVRYNGRWDEDSNAPDLGTLVTLEDGSGYTKYAAAPQMMKAMLKPHGVITCALTRTSYFTLG
jgi:adenine-specific DNA-methyltransferase